MAGQPSRAELIAAGRLQAYAALIVEEATPLPGWVDELATSAPGRPVDIIVTLRIIRTAARQGRTHAVSLLPASVPGGPIGEALGKIEATAAVALHTLGTGNRAGLVLLVKFRLPRVLGELAVAVEGLGAAVLVRATEGAPLAC